MHRLRFDKSGAHLRDAMVILATSQTPWADRVYCHPLDYESLGWHWTTGPDFRWRVMADGWDMFQTADFDPDTKNYHDITLRPDKNVEVGWVVLERP